MGHVEDGHARKGHQGEHGHRDQLFLGALRDRPFHQDHGSVCRVRPGRDPVDFRTEVDADLFLSDYPSLWLEAEYEGLITNRIILVPSIELDIPFRDDLASDVGAFGPKLEVGLRLSYDLIDRAFSPYIGVHYERVFGETADIARGNGEDPGAVFFVAGARIQY